MQKSFFLVALSLVLGCSSGGSSFPKTYPASGTVTVNGKPVNGATVNFFPVDGKGSSVGTTDASGKYTLTTYRSNDGAPPGQYKVSIVKYDAANPAPAAAALPAGQLASGDLPADYAPPKEGAGAIAPPAPKSEIPAKYNNAETSGLRGLVDATSPDNTNNFDLK